MSGLNIQLSAYVDQSATSGESFHCVVLNGFLCSMFEELYLSAVVHLPWKQFLLNIIGCNEDNLSDMLASIEEGTF